MLKRRDLTHWLKFKVRKFERKYKKVESISEKQEASQADSDTFSISWLNHSEQF